MYYEHDGLVRERYVMKQRPTGILMTKILWWACLFEYLSTSISQELLCRNLKNFLFMLSMAATRSSWGIVICYVLAILWMMSCLHIMARNKWWEERILFTKANIQYQYHKTITSGRLPEGAKRTFNQWLTGGSTNCLVLLHSVEHDVKDVLHGGDLLRHRQMCCTMDVQMVSSDLRLYSSPHVGSGADKTKLNRYRLKTCENELVSILLLEGLQPLNSLNPTCWWSELANGMSKEKGLETSNKDCQHSDMLFSLIIWNYIN